MPSVVARTVTHIIIILSNVHNIHMEKDIKLPQNIVSMCQVRKKEKRRKLGYN